MQLTLEQAESLLRQLTQAVDDDAQAYETVVSAYKMPRSSQGERVSRAEGIQRALGMATRVPLRVAHDCAHLLDLARVVAEKGNPNAASDAAVAALLAQAGLRGAVENVMINLPGIDDPEFAEQVRSEVEQLLGAIPDGARGRGTL
jgi:formiminotetrahydrofolate cyclodeaminase